MKNSHAPPPASENAARRQLHWHFVETLQRLPEQLSLSRYDPALPKARFGAGTTAALYEDDDDLDPRYFDICYWLVGAGIGVSDDYFDLVVKVWNDLRWGTTICRNSRPRSAIAHTPGGYEFTIQQSIYGHLSLSGATPPFPPNGTGGYLLPETIEHP